LKGKGYLFLDSFPSFTATSIGSGGGQPVCPTN